MTRILTILRTPGAMLFALVLALIAQLEHTAQVFSMVVGATGIGAQLHAYAFAVAVETDGRTAGGTLRTGAIARIPEKRQTYGIS